MSSSNVFGRGCDRALAQRSKQRRIVSSTKGSALPNRLVQKGLHYLLIAEVYSNEETAALGRVEGMGIGN
jgi:hypothetical protein